MAEYGKNMAHAPRQRISWFRFYEELNDFLPAKVCKTRFPWHFTGTPSVKNTIEAIGVPHVEIDLILVNGISAGFDQLLNGGEEISVYPVFESFDISPVIRLREKPLRTIRFVVDVNLGKLARKLRLLGFDTLFSNQFKDDEIVSVSKREKRIILTRDLGVLMYSAVRHGYWLRSDNPVIQVKEVVERFQLQNRLNPFSRCSNCNGKLEKVSRQDVETRVHSETFSSFNTFWKCTTCENIYWKGSHYDRISEWVERLKQF